MLKKGTSIILTICSGVDMWYLRIHSKILHITNMLSNNVRNMSNWLNVFFIFLVNSTGTMSKLDKNPMQPRHGK